MKHVRVRFKFKKIFLLMFVIPLGIAQGAAQEVVSEKSKKSLCKKNSDIPCETVEVVGSEIKQNGPISLNKVSDTASRLGLQVKELPVSIDVIDAKTIAENGDRNITDVVQRIAGFSGVSSPTVGSNFASRGFNGVTWLYNGIETPGSTLEIADANHYEKIEFLHGPSSILNGLSSIGGSVNVISRKATFEQQPVALDYAYSSFDSHRFHLGSGGKLIKDVIAYRADISRNQQGSYVKGKKTTQTRFTGSLLIPLTHDAAFTLDIDRMLNNTKNPYFGTPLINGKVDKSLRRINYNNLSDSKIKSHATSLRANFDWSITPHISLHNNIYYYKGFREWRNVERYIYFPEKINKVEHIERNSWGDLSHDNRLIANRLYTVMNHSLGSMSNRLSLGTEISETQFDYKNNGFPYEPKQKVSLRNPESSSFDQNTTSFRKPKWDIKIKQWSLFAEDQLNLTNTLKFINGLRLDHLKGDWFYYDDKSSANKTHHFTSWRSGLVYDLTPGLTTYLSYTTATEPNSNLYFMGKKQTQEKLTSAKQWEIGVKSQFWENKGEMTVAIYDINKSNMLIPDPNIPGKLVSVGKQHSRGAEVNFGLQPHWQWELNANLAYTHARFKSYYTTTPRPMSLKGKTPAYIPTWTGNLAVTFRPIEQIKLKSLLHYVGSSYNNNHNAWRVPSHTTIDLVADYQLNSSINMGLRARNVTNKFYYHQRSGYLSSQVLIAEPRSYELFMGLTF